MPVSYKALDTIQDELVTISGIVSNLVSFSDQKGSEQESICIDSVKE
jgi:hypothetical protein